MQQHQPTVRINEPDQILFWCLPFINLYFPLQLLVINVIVTLSLTIELIRHGYFLIICSGMGRMGASVISDWIKMIFFIC